MKITNKEELLHELLRNKNALYNASDELKNDPDVMLAAVKQDISLLYRASDELKNDKDFMLEVLSIIEAREKHSIFCIDGKLGIQYASDELKNDKDFMLEAVGRSRFALEHISNKLKNDKDFILEAAKRNQSAFKYASDELKNDKDFMLMALKHGMMALRFASFNVLNDREFMFKALKQKLSALEYASESIKSDKDFMLRAIKYNVDTFKYASDSLNHDKDILLEKEKAYETISNEILSVLQDGQPYTISSLSESTDMLRKYNIQTLSFVCNQLMKNEKIKMYHDEKKIYYIINMDAKKVNVIKKDTETKRGNVHFKNIKEKILDIFRII